MPTADLLLANEEAGITRRLGALAAPRTMRNILAKQGIGRKSEEEVLRDVARHAEAIAGWLGTREWLPRAPPGPPPPPPLPSPPPPPAPHSRGETSSPAP